MNIFYYSPAVPASDKSLFFSAPPLYLNSYLKVERPDLYNQVAWTKFQFKYLDQKQLVDQIGTADILCVTLYIWNVDQILKAIKGIKQSLPNLIVVVGGPSTDVIRNKEFLNHNPDIDYAVYSQGERAFADVLDHLLGNKKLSLLASKNIAWRQDSKVKLADFEFVRLEKISPYLLSAELIEQVLNDPEYQGHQFTLPYETSRGCPYNCSFCDWTSGLTHKTYFRKFDIEEELAELGRLGVTHLHLSDANFGQHKQDIEVARTMVRLKQQHGYNFKIHNTNFSKLQKDRVFEIVDILIQGDILDNLKFAVQDTDSHILDNIERPDIPWAEHKQYIDNLHQKYPTLDFGIELIQGLPGQTREKWEQNLINILPYRPIIYYWAVLPNSPAGYDTAFQEKMKLRTVLSDLPMTNEVNKGTTKVETVVETYSYTANDYAYFTLLSQIFTSVNFVNLQKASRRVEILNKIKSSRYLDATVNKIENILVSGDTGEIDIIINYFVKSLKI